jgi:peptidoglycan/xylan/chitin deacetylase (PgdA/CDA1 family)
MFDQGKKPINIGDEISHVRMQWLTGIGRCILPPGYWGHENSAQEISTIGGATDGEKNLYLTFDDGPNPDTTAALLELLEAEGVLATFFLIGTEVARFPDLARAVCAKGHTIGNHSLNHNFMPSMPTRMIEREIRHTNALLEKATGRKPKLFRPPYGMIDKRGAACLKELDMRIVYWGAVPEDWQGVGAARVVERVCRKLADGSLIVLHEGSHIASQTLEATREIVARAKAQGYTFKALPESI